ncbi:MAG TPA: hypothetical protein VFA10_27095 [Ktedonobacteraceae bacterium]|nr:hypothetical protein [Ktedonobacteraceae bacterium]
MQPQEIAIEEAQRMAALHTKEQKGKLRPYSFVYMRDMIGVDIGEALFRAGYTRHTISQEQRREIAAQALQECGYPDKNGGE